MELVINNKIIDAPIEQILMQLRIETGNHYFNTIKSERNCSVQLTCPWHKDGCESHPSCSVMADRRHPTVVFGTFHCFTCGKSAQLYSVVGYCFGKDDEFGKQWLSNNFSNLYLEKQLYLEPFESELEQPQFIDKSILDKYSYFHPYMFSRGLTEDTIRKFKVGFNEFTNSITFPIWDAKDNLVMITERSVTSKYFYIPEGVKPVYLLNYVLKANITDVWVCESQINTLLCWQRGKPAIGFIGTGSKQQYNILRNSGIRHYHLALDGDEAGDKGVIRFVANMPNDILIDRVNIPRGKDVADLSDDEFYNLTESPIL